MLATGITLKVSTTKVIEGATAGIPKSSTEKNSTLEIKLSIPVNLNDSFQVVSEPPKSEFIKKVPTKYFSYRKTKNPYIL